MKIQFPDILFIFFSLLLPLYFMISEVQVIYLDKHPENIEDFHFFCENGKNQIDNWELILLEAENKLKSYAKENNLEKIKVYIIEVKNGAISTESELGNNGFVKLWVQFDKN
ncbi:hypothetical protein [Arthrospiribacter ruber]|uniref:Uncharacterized protein n=1 Tax=Arthrospiribacter ruber TaxID=2487934 RepID=A0A951IRN6_9BACT|nr:hypothetical protein [Arthrospiribacter ruber]MBW3466715.1 hypothetical protein [Arthrospiribacter ruber]